MAWQRGLRLSALVLCGIFAASCATTSAGVGVGTGSGPVRAGVGVRTDTSDVVLSSALMGATLGSVAGPIGFAVGGIIGAIYGAHERERQERLAKAEMERQKKIDEDLLKQIEEQKKTQAQLHQALEAQLAQSETGLIVIRDHRAEELALGRKTRDQRSETSHQSPPTFPSSPPSPVSRLPSETGLIVLQDHMAEELKSGIGGDQPLGSPPGVVESGVSQEEAKRKALEAEIQAELKRQQELLAKMKETSLPPPPKSPIPPPPKVVEKEGFRWFYEGDRLIRKERDLKRDGRPDLILFYDTAGKLYRQEEDTNLDGRMDAWTVFENEKPVRKEADTDGDGRIDFWAYYDEKEELLRTESDTDRDGQRDLISFYDHGTLQKEERYDGQGEKLLAVTVYKKGRPVRKEEATKGGRLDRITYFDEEGRVVKEARDPLERGRPTFFAYYDPMSRALLREEEDLDGDGEIDVVSYYEGGRLVRRELYKLDEASWKSPSHVLPEEGSLDREVKKP